MYRIKIRSKTGYFRNDMTITGIQETYDCPPLSTIYGMISSAVGEVVEKIDVGYIFDYKYIGEDYELVITEGGGDRKKYKALMEKSSPIDRHDVLLGCFASAPVTRQILFDCVLYLYIEDKSIAECFKNPYYTMLMGRSEDIATVDEVKEVNLTERRNIFAGKTIVPLSENNGELYGKIASMPVSISCDIPRHLNDTGIYIVMKDYAEIKNAKNIFKYDDEISKGVYIHKFQKR